MTTRRQFIRRVLAAAAILPTTILPTTAVLSGTVETKVPPSKPIPMGKKLYDISGHENDGTITWTKGTGTITLSGTNNQDIDFRIVRSMSEVANPELWDGLVAIWTGDMIWHAGWDRPLTHSEVRQLYADSEIQSTQLARQIITRV